MLFRRQNGIFGSWNYISFPKIMGSSAYFEVYKVRNVQIWRFSKGFIQESPFVSPLYLLTLLHAQKDICWVDTMVCYYFDAWCLKISWLDLACNFAYQAFAIYTFENVVRLFLSHSHIYALYFSQSHIKHFFYYLSIYMAKLLAVLHIYNKVYIHFRSHLQNLNTFSSVDWRRWEEKGDDRDRMI